jgi:hypothetical protein
MDIQLINTLKDRPGRIPEVARVEHGCGRRGPLLVGDIVHGRDDKPELPGRIRSVPAGVVNAMIIPGPCPPGSPHPHSAAGLSADIKKNFADSGRS